MKDTVRRKKLLPLACSIVILLSSCMPNTNIKKRSPNNKIKKVLILTNSNGGGHNAAAAAVKMALDDNYSVEIFDILKNKLPGEYLFGYASRNESWELLEYVLKLKEIAEFINDRYYGSYIVDSIIKKNPDLLISVFPIGIKNYKEAADLLSIPYIIIPTDFNGYDLNFYGLNNFANNIDNAKKFRLFLPFKDSQTDKAFENKTIMESVKYTGYPVRKDFLKFSNEYRQNNGLADQIKKNEQIKPDDKTILIMMGAQSWAEDAIIKYTDLINQNASKIMYGNSGILHVYIICGANDALYKKISNIKIKDSQLLKIHPEQWIDGERMAKLMAISDTIIAKPGGSSSAEILAIGKHTIFKPDSTSAISWEKDNMLMVEKYNLADEFDYKANFTENNFIAAIRNGINHKQNNSNLPPINNFYENIKTEVDSLFLQ